MSSTIVGAKVIIVGGGLAGLSAAHTVLERGGRVLVLDKKDFLGGNSVKATSGINGALTKAQIKLGIPDSAELFEEDTAISANLGTKAPPHPLATVLTHQSGPAVEWLIKQFGLDLSLVSRLGGHSQPRTHRGGERFPGMTITYALMEKMEEISSARPDVAQVIVAATATKLLKDADGSINGVEYVCNGQTFTEHGPVVIATGGFGADFGKDSLLAINRPDLLHLPTTNGDHCTGDGIKMSLAVGGSTIDMKSVQVHPTGLVLPSDPDAKVKWLAAEALRGVGGILLDGNGNRFCNELGTRDYVTGCMWKNKGPFRLVLNNLGVKEIEWHCKHYVGRGLMKKFNHGRDLAKEIGCSEATLKKTLDEYNGFAKNKNDPFGKKYFQNLPFDISDNNYHVAIVTPVVHYCMGGIQIDTDANIVKDDGKTKLQGLYAAGECAGGVHGKNRLGGSGLLGCVVYGRVAGESASRYLFNQLSSGSSSSGSSSPSGINIHITFDGQKATVAGGNKSSAAPSAAAPAKGKSNLAAVAASAEGGAAPAKAAAGAAAPSGGDKTYTLEEVAKHSTDKDCWVVVNGAVLNATSFLDKHPGGKESIMLYAGKDASAEFNMLHKPDVIVKYAPHIIIGKLADGKKAKL